MITEDYAKLLQLKHRDAGFGTRAELPAKLAELLASGRYRSVLDFGCGKGRLVEALRASHPQLQVNGYDPANPAFATLPEQVDLIFSTDVLEHIEPTSLLATLQDLATRCSAQYHLIACHYATNVLADGRNAHLIVRTPDFWQEIFYSLPGWQVAHEAVNGFIKPRPQRPLAVTHYEVAIQKAG